MFAGIPATVVCAEVPSAVFFTRLLTSISTQTAHRGDAVSAVVVSPVLDDGRVVIPAGAVVVGNIAMVHRVGAGLLHERAALEIRFGQWRSTDGALHPLAARLIGVDNAREQVSANGRITGILEAGGPSGFLLGMWQRPSDDMFLRTAAGIAGFTGFVGHLFEFDPIGIMGIAALRLAVVPSGDPEIWYPRGTDLILSLTSKSAGEYPAEATPEPPSPELVDWSAAVPVQTTLKGMEKPDITNVAFLGSQEQVVNAFVAAGWSEPEPLTRSSAMRFYRAMSAQRGYATAPMASLLLNDKAPDLEFEKSLNTVARRHHLRIWREGTFEGQEAWAGAGTHDIGVRLTGRGFTHAIDARIDGERSRIVDDLAFAGCVEDTQFIERPKVASSIGDTITDGRLAVLKLRDCSGTPVSDEPPHETVEARLGRRLVLEARYAVLRGNVYYWGYRAAKALWMKQRQAKAQPGADPEIAEVKKKSVTAQ